MSLISYAQNFEDVMLWRALKHIESGFYLDIGAQDPFVDSVSLAFYEHGWRGCHVEPTSQYSTKLRGTRPDELVLQVAVGESEKKLLTFYEFEDTGLSTVDLDIALAHQERGFKYKETTVPIIPLSNLFEQIGDRDIHWMKVDVEGAEASVLKSWGTTINRPWILVIESTKPLTQIENFSEWEFFVLDRGYEFVYFDGLNRFYVSDKHPELKQSFVIPPNVFDGFLLSGLASQPFYKLVESRAIEAKNESQRSKALIEQMNLKVLQLDERAQESEGRAAALASELQSVYRSSSWVVTKPLRAIIKILSGIF